MTGSNRRIVQDDRTQLETVRMEFAKFCALTNPDEHDAWYKRGLEDFPRLLSIDGVTGVGIDWQSNRLLVSTELIVAYDKRDDRKEIGEFIVFFDPFNKQFTFENVSGGLLSDCGGYHHAHPHISNGEMCITTGRAEIIHGMIDARYSVSMRIILAALRMRENEGYFGHPYHPLERWPTKEQVV